MSYLSSSFQGNLGKKLDLVPAFKEYFFVLQPHKLSFYSGQSQRESKGEVKLDAQCRVESVKGSGKFRFLQIFIFFNFLYNEIHWKPPIR